MKDGAEPRVADGVTVRPGRRPRTFLAGLGVAGVALLSAGQAVAAPTATMAPIGAAGSGNYLVTLVNGTAEKSNLETIELGGGETATSIVPAGCVYGQPLAGWLIGCGAIEVGATLEVCYHGPAAVQVSFFQATMTRVPVSTVGAVGSCPVPGFDPPSAGSSPTPSPAPAGGGGAGGPASPAPAAAEPKLGKVTVDARNGTAKVTVTVPGAGTVKLSGKGVAAVSKSPAKAGSLVLPVRATGNAAGRLEAHGSVKLHLVVTFAPKAGPATTLRKVVKLQAA